MRPPRTTCSVPSNQLSRSQMPTYEFRCPNGHEFEHFYRSHQRRARRGRLPVCGKLAERQISGGAGLVFKGSGFYITDYGKDGKKDQRAPRQRRAARRRASRRAARASAATAKAASRRRARDRTPRATPSSGEAGSSGGTEARAEETAAPSHRKPTAANECCRSAPRRARRAARTLGAPEDIDPLLERPRDPAHGDWATNLAMMLAKPLQREAARDRRGAASTRLDLRRAGVSTSRSPGPGFINFRLDAGRARRRARATSSPTTRATAAADAGAGRPVNVEFVSANPTGPLHVGHGRQAALGDAIATLLECTGWKRDARVLLQRRRRADRESGRAASRRALPAQLGRRGRRDPRGRLPRRVHPRDRRSATSRSIAGDARRRRRSMRCASFAVARAAPRAGSRPPGVRRRFDTYFLGVVALHRRHGRRAPSGGSRQPGTRTRTTARSGSAPPTSATTRIA